MTTFEQEILYQIAKQIAETDSVAEGYLYNRKGYSKQDFEIDYKAKGFSYVTVAKDILALLSTTIEGCIPEKYNPQNPTLGECKCIYDKNGKQRGKCLRCVKLSLYNFHKGKYKCLDTITDNLRKAGVI